MNKAYSKNKKIKKLDWKENDLCAVFIHKFGNWYRGKIIKLDSKKTATVSLLLFNMLYGYLDMKNTFCTVFLKIKLCTDLVICFYEL